jgi:hypothetical protein
VDPREEDNEADGFTECGGHTEMNKEFLRLKAVNLMKIV